MQSLKKFYFSKQKAKVNTYIGGIGGTINTPALLASKLGISESRIKLFKVTGVDVECAIVGENTLSKTSFHNDANVTYFINTSGITFIHGQNASQTTFFNNPKLHTVFLEKCTYFEQIPNGPLVIFRLCPSLKKVYVPNLLNIGLLATRDTSAFLQMQSTPKIYVNPFMSTSNAGAEEGDIAYARSQGASIRYVTNFTPPTQITDLTVGTIYNTAVQLNFTPPTAVNGIDFYEVYVNGRYNNDISTSGGFATGLVANTTQTIEVYAVDMFYNKSSKSNTISVTTANITYTDADAIAYSTASGISTMQQQESVHVLFNGLKSNALYAKIQAGWLFKGATANNQKFNIKNPQDTDAAFRLQFFGTGTYSDLGFQTNGSNAYADTKFIPSANQNVNSNGLTVVVGTNNNVVPADAWEIGGFNSGTQCSILTTKSGNTTFKRQLGLNNATYVVQSGINDAKGIYTGLKILSNLNKFYRNGLIIGSGLGGGTLPTSKIFIGNISVNNAPNASYSSQRIQMAFMHEGLTDAEVVKMHEIIDLSEIIAGRKTW